MRAILCCALLTACVTPQGQKVRALLVDHELTCNDSGDGETFLASMELSQEGDYYVAEVVEGSTGHRITVPSTRDGAQVVFVCPPGLEVLTVRTASVLSEAAGGDETTTAGPPP
jgi:hypothetical protein